MNIKSKIYNNKFKLIMAEDNSHPLVCLQLYVRTGSAWESPEESGYSHFVEHLVFKSTKHYTDSSIMERVSFLGGTINAYTEFDSTCYYVTLPSQFINEGLEILQQLVRFSNFSREDFISEKKVIFEELKQFRNDPEDYFVENITALYLEKNLYRNPIIGNEESLKNAKHEDVMSFYKRHYVPNNCFLVACGKYDAESLQAQVNDYFGDWEFARISKLNLIKEKPNPKSEIIEIQHKIQSNILAFVLPDISERNPDSYALSLAMKAFAIGKNSRLYTRLSTKENIVDNIKVHSISGMNDGLTIIAMMPKTNADLNEIIEIFMEEYHRLLEYGLTQSEIDEYKKELIHYFRYSYEYVESLASSLGTEELINGFENFEVYPQKIRTLDKGAIDGVIFTYLKKEFLKIYKMGKGSIELNKIRALLNKKFIAARNGEIKGDFFQTTFENGFKLTMKKVIGKPTIGVALTSEVSQLNEIAENRGLNLLTAGMLLYGNEEKNYKQFLQFCTTNGVHFGISPKSETTSVNLKCFKESLPQCLQLLRDVILKPLFPREHLENLKQSYISNFNRIKDYPHYNALKSWKQMMFGKQSNIISSEGTKSTVRRFSRNHLKNWYKQYYGLTGLNLVIVGDFDFSMIYEICAQLFSQKIEPVLKSQQQVIYEKAKNRYRRVNQNSDQAIINIGGFGCGFDESEKNTAFHVLEQLLGGDMNSLLFNELREKKGLAYSVDFDFRSVRNFGYFLVSAIVDRDNYKEAIETIKETLLEVRINGINENQLEKVKNYIRGQRLMDEESMIVRAQTLSMLESLGLGYQYYLDREKRLRNVSIESIHEIAKEYFNDDNFYIHVLT